MPKVTMWLEVDGLGKVSEDVEVPDHCFDAQGKLIEEDVIECVEEWVQRRARWGFRPI